MIHRPCSKDLTVARLLVILCLVCVGSGCLKVREHLVLRADGSGTVTIETQSAVPPDAVAMIRGRGGMNDYLCYPPLTKDDAMRLFPGGDFTVEAKETQGEAGYSGLTVEVAFKDVNALLASPYGRAHSMEITVRENSLRFTALCGLEGLVPVADAKDLGPMGEGVNLVEVRAKKNEMCLQFKATLPNKVQSSNGSGQGGSAEWKVDWPALEKAVKAAGMIGGRMTAACAADGLRFTPSAAPRLNLVRFGELKAGPTGAKQAGPDEKKVLQSVRFVPLFLRTKRYFDLIGENGAGERSLATLNGLLLIPRDVLPQRRGEVAIVEVVDDRGNDLRLQGESRPERSDDLRPYMEEAIVDTGAARPYPVSFSFKVPARDARQIARIKATVDLYYPSELRIVKLAGAIPKERVMEEGQSMRDRGLPLSDPELAKLGLPLSIMDARESGDMTAITVWGTAAGPVPSEIQVYDAEGAPWQSLATSYSQPGHYQCSLNIPGKPKPPLSLALLVSTTGKPVKAPISLEHVPITSQVKKPGASRSLP